MSTLWIDMELPFPKSCGKPCVFCHYRLADDMYHCVFFKDDLDTALLNDAADRRMKYKECPVRRKAEKK